MMKVSIRTCVAFLVLVFLNAQCTEDKGFKKYKELVKSERASGKHADSVFLGIHFGMTSKEFFTYCWEMNKKGLFTDGESNTAVLYRLNHNELKYPASMNFYPEMVESRINKMRATFQYDGWAPWNKQLFSDKLVEDVLNLYKKWYNNGNPFIKINEPGKNTIYVKVDGNRRIIIGIKDDGVVKVDYTDLCGAIQK